MQHYDVMILSGAFDPLHVGHIRMIKQARSMAALVVVGVNSDAWLVRRQGRALNRFEDRCEIVAAIKGVTSAVGFEDADDTAVSLIKMVCRLSPGARIAFGNGGSRTSTNVPEVTICDELGVDLVWGVGGDALESSSGVLERAAQF